MGADTPARSSSDPASDAAGRYLRGIAEQIPSVWRRTREALRLRCQDRQDEGGRSSPAIAADCLLIRTRASLPEQVMVLVFLLPSQRKTVGENQGVAARIQVVDAGVREVVDGQGKPLPFRPLVGDLDGGPKLHRTA